MADQLTVEAPEKGEDHSFSDTACGLGKALGKLTLTPVVGVGLMGIAATDAISTGVTGTTIKARKVLYKINKDDLGAMEGSAANETSAASTGVGDIRASANAPPGRTAAMPIEIFDLDTCDYTDLRRNYLDKGVPFVLKRSDGKPISNASPPKTAEDSPEGSISVLADSMTVKLDGIDEIVRKVLPSTFRAHWPLWFQGNYKSGLAHVDLGPGTTNFYFLKRGKKDVVICPFEVTRDLTLVRGIDNVHIPGSAGNHDYLDTLEGYYRILLEEQSILVFNNSGCLHHFTNIIEEGVTPIALSNRCKHAYGSDPRVWLNLAANLKVWYNMADHAVDLQTSGDQVRKAEKA
uniref:JmjC domain-containing protein n=1 Tax=Odontella aurita TaxID=265563 RepID=A0A7S4MGF9_9STRA|mmetsp:Transcript_20909/g.60894  ORF Transcript_20909/g.60894 Transcript_20909/m.60894 type:complete len:348 (+) Transcript_20909:74-1117(+)